jgi:hypothetical protein
MAQFKKAWVDLGGGSSIRLERVTVRYRAEIWRGDPDDETRPPSLDFQDHVEPETALLMMDRAIHGRSVFEACGHPAGCDWCPRGSKIRRVSDLLITDGEGLIVKSSHTAATDAIWRAWLRMHPEK